MDYKKLTRQQIYTGEANYTLEDFAKDFKKQAKKNWGNELLNKKNKTSHSLYQVFFLIVVFASQRKPLKLINELLIGRDTKELQEALKEFIDMFEQEIKVLEGLQMRMFIDNIEKYGVSDSLNLKLLNADFQAWLEKALNLPKNEEATKH